MRLIKTTDYEQMTTETLNLLVEAIKQKPDLVLCLTTGASPEGLVKKLCEEVLKGNVSIKDTTFINLDEFIAPTNNNYSVKRFMDECIYAHLSEEQLPKNRFMLDGEATDFEAEIARFKKILKDYPRDIQLLGLGINGHLGCNEPGVPFEQELFVGNLSESTIVKTMGQFDLTYEETPKQMFTMGIKDIMDAKTVWLQVSGTHKAQALKDMLENEITVDCPASILNTHLDAVVIYDEDAGSLLSK